MPLYISPSPFRSVPGARLASDAAVFVAEAERTQRLHGFAVDHLGVSENRGLFILYPK